VNIKFNCFDNWHRQVVVLAVICVWA